MARSVHSHRSDRHRKFRQAKLINRRTPKNVVNVDGILVDVNARVN